MLEKRGSRKGFVEIQFHWLFVLLVGALILIFFITIAGRQRESAGKTLSVELLADLELLVTGQGVSIGRSNAIEMPKITLGFTCDDYQISTQTRRIGNAILFTPGKIEGPKLITWTLDWNLPYRAANIVYLTSSHAKYYLVFNPSDPNGIGVAELLKAEMPKDMDVAVLPSPKLAQQDFENNYFVKFIFLITPPQALPAAFQRIPVQGLHLQFANPQDIREATATFLSWNGNAWQTEGIEPLFGKEMLYATIFAENIALFACNMDKAWERYFYISGIYRDRAVAIMEKAKVDCQYIFNRAIHESLNVIVDQAERRLQQEEFDPEELQEAVLTLESRNDEAVLKSCPTLY